MSNLPLHPNARITRREAIGTAAGLALAGVASRAHAQALPTATRPETTANGVVFDDSDNTARRTASSQGVPDVLVSNGRDVVKTDSAGHWSLSVRAGDAIFVIKPPGWMTQLDPATQLPRYAALYLPDGTPESLNTRFAGIPPTGPLPASIDFPLRRQIEAPKFNAILFTDTQPESLAELGYIRDDVVAQTAGVEAAFGITHGDLMFDDLAHYDRYNRIVGTIGMPWYNCPGNHDMNLEAPDNSHSRDTYKRVFGARYSAFQYGSATFFTLDNVEYLGADPTKPNDYGKYQGRFGPDQLDFIRNVLANVPTDSLVVYSLHIPLKTLQGSDAATANTDTRAFLEAISGHPNSVSFSGHTHTNEHWYFGAADGFSAGSHHHHVLAAVSGSWWSGPYDERGIPVAVESDGSPNGFHILAVDGTNYETTLVPARDPARSQIRIMLDSQIHEADPEILRDYHNGALLTGPIEQAACRTTRVVVNLFDGGPRSKVMLVAGRGSEPVTMQKVERRDPFVDELYVRNRETKKPWVKSDKSSHIWQAALPDLPAGAHRLAVNATDEFGRNHTAWMVLEVTN